MTKAEKVSATLKSNGLSWQTVVLTVSLAIIAAVPPTITALAAKTEAREAKLEAGAAKAQAVVTHDLVNSRLSEVLPVLVQGAADAATLKEKDAQAMRQGAAATATNAATKK